MYLITGSHSKLCIIADAPLPEDVYRGRLFVSFKLIPTALHAAGISFHNVVSTALVQKPLHFQNRHLDYITTVKTHAKAKGWVACDDGVFASQEALEARERVLEFLDTQEPACVLLVGELALWAVTGQSKIHSCRGSIYESLVTPSGRTFKTVCTLSPRDLSLSPELSLYVERDVERAIIEMTRGPQMPRVPYNFLLQASFRDYCQQLDDLILKCDESPDGFYIAVDIETIRRQIACVGIAYSNFDCVVIPIRTAREYWSVEEEVALIQRMARLFEHKNVRIIGQNFHYDAMYFAVKWGIAPRCADDTMIAQHIVFVELPKGLHILASVYSDHYRYWKDERDDYNLAPADDHKFFRYNAQDCCYTYECMPQLRRLVAAYGLSELYTERMTRQWYTLLRVMLRGIPVDEYARSRLGRYEVTHGIDSKGMPTVQQKLVGELVSAEEARVEFLNYVIGREFNFRSSVQMKQFFYEEMRVPPVKSRVKKDRDSLGAEILQKIPDDFPLLGPIVDAIIEARSLRVFLKNFVLSRLDKDGSMRCSYGMAGTDTFRLSSSTNAFDMGGNLQNIPKGDRARTKLKMPNIRELYKPPVGRELFDIDLAGADAQVVAWEARDEKLKDAFRAGLKIHAVNSKDLFGGNAGPDGKAEPYYTRTKMGVHLSNYGGKPPTMAKALGITIHEAEKFQARWFDIHPEIKDWHKRIESDLQSQRCIYNKFGYRRQFFGRIDKALPVALAWIPQSTVAIVTNKAMDTLDLEFATLWIHLQVHDSIVFSLPIYRPPELIDNVMQATRIVIPYEDPLIIPFGVKSSVKCWGECG